MLNRFGTLDEIYRFPRPGQRVNDAELKPAQRASLEELRTRVEDVRALVKMRTDVPLDAAEVFKPRVPTTKEFMKGETNMKDGYDPNGYAPDQDCGLKHGTEKES